jgi:iodotyrosine deiodinase
MKHRFTTVPLAFERIPEAESLRRARVFREEIEKRRSVRHFAPDAVSREAIDECIVAAGSAPSGANRQPWTFVVVTDAETRRAIREAAEEEERRNYGERMSEEWLEALAPLGTSWEKPFLEIAPALIVVFRHAYGEEGGKHVKNYYTMESVGIAVGFLLVALHHAGFATLTHTPSPMGFLQKILGRPENEKAFVLIPVGYPAPGCAVPDIARKTLEEIRYPV